MTADAQTRPAEPSEEHDCSMPGHQHGYLETRDAYLARLRRIEGQVRGIARMVDEGKYCIDILTQVSAATSALQSVALALLDEHLHSCVLDAARQGDEQGRAKLEEASRAIARLVKS
jgi:DNA-binding FrmR family transcriptional regulator